MAESDIPRFLGDPRKHTPGDVLHPLSRWQATFAEAQMVRNTIGQNTHVQNDTLNNYKQQVKTQESALVIRLVDEMTLDRQNNQDSSKWDVGNTRIFIEERVLRRSGNTRHVLHISFDDTSSNEFLISIEEIQRNVDPATFTNFMSQLEENARRNPNSAQKYSDLHFIQNY